MDQQEELIMRQQQTIQQLNEILAKREQEKEQGSSVRIEGGNFHCLHKLFLPNCHLLLLLLDYMSKQKSLHHRRTSHNSPIHKLSINSISIILLSLMASLMCKRQRHGS
ncbi:uncharacterized protein G2W53_032991 [Senna tora]|uniref:Uncharacterized protein n=1 Tax=Senna tora TaxID=362788 RepID=A0A834W6Q7_9FABA|nr:uncharacterized protein G2W53_032991 [Senna tora]